MKPPLLVFRVHAVQRMFQRGISKDVGFELQTQENSMKCVICKQGDTQAGTATVTLERNGMTLVIRHVPARICTNCGEEYVEEVTTSQILSEAEKAIQAGGQVHIREFVTV
jgi:YgiT-type zinc finger domain-containing protein